MKTSDSNSFKPGRAVRRSCGKTNMITRSLHLQADTGFTVAWQGKATRPGALISAAANRRLTFGWFSCRAGVSSGAGAGALSGWSRSRNRSRSSTKQE
eukprot:768441-Hanusia_phi.AAC.13